MKPQDSILPIEDVEMPGRILTRPSAEVRAELARIVDAL